MEPFLQSSIMVMMQMLIFNLVLIQGAQPRTILGFSVPEEVIGQLFKANQVNESVYKFQK